MSNRVQPAGTIAMRERWDGKRLGAVVAIATAVVLDGFDNQLLGYIAPAVMKQWSIERNSFATIIALSLVMMCIGTALAGKVGDRLGRRPVLIGSVVLFGLMTSLSATATGPVAFAITRAIAALGLGGAMPNATALLAEIAPERQRSLVVSLGIVCIPVGGFVGGLVAAAVLPTADWHTLVLIGGVAPLVLGLVMFFLLPESPTFLMRRARADDPSVPHAADITSVSAPDGTDQAGLFDPAWRRDTCALWSAFFFCLLAVYAMFNWAPSLLTQAGLDIAIASGGLSAFNFGGIFGALAGALLMDRMGSRRPTIVMAFAGAALSAAASFAIAGGAAPALVIALFAVAGFFIPGLQVLLFALAASIYPPHSRSTGVGAALAVGRTGAIVSALAGSVMLNLGTTAFLLLITGSMLLAAFSLMAVSRHQTARRPS